MEAPVEGLSKKPWGHIVALNLSETQNDRNRLKPPREGMSENVDIVHGDFADIPAVNDSFDVVSS